MQHFVDEVKIEVRSGKGGAGCVSFRREKRVPKGGPDGGDGGDGGSVVFVVKSNVRTLYNLFIKKRFYAKNGTPGMGSQMYGKKGEDVEICVPPGTIIYDDETGEIIKDFQTDNERFVFLKGGKGGRGNMHFATSTNQAPRYAQPGLPGEEATLRVELKLIADVGLVGFPNAGKSTLLSVVSAARPKIANYPFTTLVPNLGVVALDDFDTFVMADIPGIIEGASDGAGLGIEFLKHIERTKILLYMVDLTGDDYLEQFGKLQNEIKRYSAELAKKPFMVAATKLDVPGSEERLAELREKIGQNVIGFSSVTHTELKTLLYALVQKIRETEK
ncbi:MAG: GTPase ObgE [Spirochaetales bacterium]|nr:GTPase ObgE [Spirochaetales bacterium]